jgi:serine/threonine-protein kinase
MKYETAKFQYNDVDIVVDDYVYSDSYANGVICEQKPKANGPAIKVNEQIKVTISNGPQMVTLQDFSGQRSDQVLSKLREDGLEAVEERDYSDSVPMGNVIYTNPSAGSEVKAGTKVSVYVSNGPKENLVEIPADILGMNLNQAEQYLALSSLEIDKVTEEPSDLPDGTILSVEPEVGSMQPEGTKLNVIVSRGDGKRMIITVPLPDMKQAFTIRASDVEETILAQDEIQPGTTVWKPSIVGASDEVLEVRIYISTPEMAGRRYQTYRLDFDELTQTLISDRSKEAEFNP